MPSEAACLFSIIDTPTPSLLVRKSLLAALLTLLSLSWSRILSRHLLPLELTMIVSVSFVTRHSPSPRRFFIAFSTFSGSSDRDKLARSSRLTENSPPRGLNPTLRRPHGHLGESVGGDVLVRYHFIREGNRSPDPNVKLSLVPLEKRRVRDRVVTSPPLLQKGEPPLPGGVDPDKEHPPRPSERLDLNERPDSIDDKQVGLCLPDRLQAEFRHGALPIPLPQVLHHLARVLLVGGEPPPLRLLSYHVAHHHALHPEILERPGSG